MIDVVYIDDEVMLLRSIRFIIEDEGLTVRTFESPTEAIQFINENDVGVVLCDYRMPQMSGLDVLDALDKALPFFLISGDLALEDELEDELETKGRVTAFISKPFSPADLARQLKDALGR